MGERKVGKRIDSANVWPQLTALHQCAQLIKLAAVLSGENEVITRVLAPGLNDVLWLCNVHDRDHAAKLCEHIGATRQCVAADGVEHDIDSAASRFPEDGVDVILLFVVDDHIGTQASCELRVCLAHGREYLGADGFCQLDRDMTDASRAAVYEDALPTLSAARTTSASHAVPPTRVRLAASRWLSEEGFFPIMLSAATW